MENRYYIPKLEEFHVGFECEYWNSHSKKYIPFVVEESNYYVDYVGGPDEDYIFKDNYSGFKPFRVKYLDKEDIESLGFKYYKTHPGTTTLEFEGDKCNITFDSEFSKYWNITITHTEDGDFTYFHGSIKNKSELKKVMKMLGI